MSTLIVAGCGAVATLLGYHYGGGEAAGIMGVFGVLATLHTYCVSQGAPAEYDDSVG